MTILHFAVIVANKLWKIIGTGLGLAAALFLLATVLPKEYKAKTIAAISAGGDQSGLGISSIISDLPVPSFLKGGLGGSSEKLDVVQTILESDMLHYRLIDRFHYDSIYTKGKSLKKKKPREIILRAFNKKFKTEIDDQDAIHVSMVDKSPIRAARVCNDAISLTDSILNRLSIQQAEKRVAFFDKQIMLQKARLNAAEDAAREYLEKHNVSFPEEQAAATIEATVELDARIISAEVNLALMRQKYRENHPKVAETKEVLSRLKKKRNEIVSSKADHVMLPLRNLPKTMVEFGRLKRDLKIQQAIFQTLLPELEAAKLEQFKTIPLLQFIQKATPAERRSFPPRFVWTMLGLAFGLCASTFWFCFDSYRSYLQANNPTNAELLDNLFAGFKKSFLPFARKK